MSNGSRRVSLMGMAVDSLSEDEVVEIILKKVALGQGGAVITANLDHLRHFHDSLAIRSLYSSADLVVPDGMPLVWASRIQGIPLSERVAGSDLIWAITAGAAREGATIFLIGGSPGAAQRAATVLKRCYPHVQVGGVLSPPMGFDPESDDLSAITDALRSATPEIVFVGLGFPKQELLFTRLRATFPSTWFIGVGVSFSFVAGDIARAPTWMQWAGLEWLHRFAQEPQRLGERYFIRDVPFAVKLFSHAVWSRISLLTRSPNQPRF